MQKKPLYLEIFLTSLAGLLLEIAYTRIFSFKVFYYFTYLIIGLGLLGIGSGGVALAVSERLRRMPPGRLVSYSALCGGGSILAGYFAIAPLQMNVSKSITDPGEIAILLLVSALLMVPFLAVGLIVSTILSSDPERSNRLYGADLIGAALGCMLVIPLLKALDPPGTIALAAVALALAGVRPSRDLGKTFYGAMALVVALAVPVAVRTILPEPIVAEGKTLEDFRDHGLIKFSKWHPVFRVDASEHPFYPGELLLLHHDGLPGSGIRRFDGDLGKWKSLEKDPRALPFEVLAPEPKVLIIGAAGGREILASLYFRAGHVTGVELNPVTYSLVTDVFADFSGRLHENPKVTYMNGDGRWFLNQTDQKFDLIWFVAPDSYAAMNASSSGAFVLSESYLYTVEMLETSLAHLTDRGIVCTQFGELDYDHRPNRTTRYVATAREAFRRNGVANFANHVLVSSATGFPPFLESVVLLGKSAFLPEQVERFERKAVTIDGGLIRHVPGRPFDETPVNRVIALGNDALDGWLDHHRYMVDAVRDDSPFFWHFARYRDAITAPLPGGGEIIDYEDVIAEQITLLFLFVVSVLAAVLLLLPFRIRPVWSDIPHKRIALSYFAALGLGFMFLEVALIQKLTLFLGYPTYSLSVTLFGVLVSSGLGSIASRRLPRETPRAALTALGGLAIAVVGYQALIPIFEDRLIGQPLALRAVLAILLIAPVGACLGVFMPVGLRAIAATTEHAREYIAWAWAVNGFFSVIASILATILAMVIGFKWLMVLALAIYAGGVLALSRLPSGVRARAG
jgi:hypothetical protein